MFPVEKKLEAGNFGLKFVFHRNWPEGLGNSIELYAVLP